MKQSARITCNSCRLTVAVKNCFRYTPVKDYITVKATEMPLYYDDSVNKVPLHYCSECWRKFHRAVLDSMEQTRYDNREK